MTQKKTDVGLHNHLSLPLSIICVLFFLLIIIFFNGCMLRKSGKAEVSYFKIEASEELIGLTKSEVIDRLGLADGTITDEKGVEYWVYKNERGYHFIVFGRSKKKDLILQFDDNNVKSVHLMDEGSSISLTLPTILLQ